MNPFLILLMGLGATVGADAHGEWRKRQRMDDLRRKLGLWEQSPTYFKGSIANRLNWIESQFGLRAAIWAREAAVLSVAPLGFFKSHDDTGIAPFLPWLAWRLVNGDKPELVAVLEAEHHQVEKDVEYTKDHAWSDIRRLLDWYEGARPDLFDYTWNQAIAAEQKWFPTSIKIWKGELVYRFALREDDIDEDDKQGTGEWIVTEMLDLDARIAAVSHFTGTLPTGSSLYGETVYVLQDPTGEPQAAIIATERNDRMLKVLGENVAEWSYEGWDDEETFSKLVEFMWHQWPDPSSWIHPVWAFLNADDEKRLEMIETHSDILGSDDGQLIDRLSYEEFDGEFMNKWAEVINAEPHWFDNLYVETAVHQFPSESFLLWLETGKEDPTKKQEVGKNAEERIPSILHQYVYDDTRSDADITSMHDSGEYDNVLPWEIKIWDLYTHPSGAELEVKAQIYVIYQETSYAWVVSMQASMEFREKPMDPSTWVRSDNHEDFVFHSIVGSPHWGTGRNLDPRAIEKVFEWRGPFQELETTHSLDDALKAAWTGFKELFDNLAPDDQDRIERYFVQQDLVDPRPEIEGPIPTLWETFEILKRSTTRGNPLP